MERGNKLIITKCKRSKVLRINKEIILDGFLFEIVGLYFGDGLNTRSYSGIRRTAFANSNYKLHQYWIKFLSRFGIKKRELFAQISTHKHADEGKVLEYWIKKTHIPKNSFARVSKSKERCSGFGVLSTEFNSITFRLIFNEIFDHCLEILSKKRKFIPNFIKGLFAAEGHVTIRNKSVQMLGIAIKDHDRRKYVQSLLKKINVTSSENKPKDALWITGYFNFKIFEQYKMASLHPQKNEKFKRGFLNLSKSWTPGITKTKIIAALRKKNLSRGEIATLLEKNSSLIHKMLRDLEIKRIVKRVGKRNGIRKKIDIWGLGEKRGNIQSIIKYEYGKPKNTIAQ